MAFFPGLIRMEVTGFGVSCSLMNFSISNPGKPVREFNKASGRCTLDCKLGFGIWDLEFRI
jgi:hypothetical protein